MQTAPRDSQIIHKSTSTGDAWFRHRKQPLGTEKSSTNCSHGSRMDWTAQTAPRDSQIINKSTSTGDAWIRKRKHPLGTQESSTNCFHR
jgi:hypothetical protein